MDYLFNSKEKRFIVFYSMFGLIITSFLYGVFRFSSAVLTIESTRQLMLLTDPNIVSLYWPVEAVARIMDQRLTIMNVFSAIVQAIPFPFFVASFSLLYCTLTPFNKKHSFNKHQQGMLIITFFVVVSQFAMILMFLYGFLGGSVASAINRLHISGYIGYASSIILVLLFLIMIGRLLIDFLALNEEL